MRPSEGNHSIVILQELLSIEVLYSTPVSYSLQADSVEVVYGYGPAGLVMRTATDRFGAMLDSTMY